MTKRVSGLSPEQFRQLVAAVMRDPLFFSERILGDRLWRLQKRIIRDVFAHKRVAVKSCHGSGKSFIASRIALTWLLTYRPSLVVTTAPTWRQVEDVLWREIGAAVQKGGAPEYLGALGARLYESPLLEIEPNWYMTGVSARDAEKFAGFHSAHVLIIVDEASGVSGEIFEAAEGVLAAGHSHILLIGNPTRPEGVFYHAFTTEADIWVTHTISAFDTPAFTGEGHYPFLIQPEWVEERRQAWGVDSPAYQVRVLGEFPQQGLDTLYPLHLIEAAAALEREEIATKPKDHPIEYGVDAARFGLDETVVYARRGPYVVGLEAWQRGDEVYSATRIASFIERHGKGRIKIDVVGPGGGIASILRSRGFEVLELNASSQSSDPEVYPNLKVEMYMQFRDRLKNGQVAGLTDDITQGQLSAIRYGFDTRQRWQIEDKDAFRKRHDYSPDRAEALILAFFEPHARPGFLGPILSAKAWSRR